MSNLKRFDLKTLNKDQLGYLDELVSKMHALENMTGVIADQMKTVRDRMWNYIRDVTGLSKDKILRFDAEEKYVEYREDDEEEKDELKKRA